MKYHHRKGFTLIELLVVVLIIGILATVALPQYQKAVIKSRLRLAQTLAEDMLRAQELYYLTHSVYASSSDELDFSFPTPLKTEYEEAIERTTLFYPWGYCQFHGGNGVGCYNTQSGIAYQRSIGSKAECKVLTDTTISKQVCVMETGQAEPFYIQNVDSGGWSSYRYP